jgi:putative YphP/YqiW family bacilliredoxin
MVMPQISLKSLMNNSAPNYGESFVEPFRKELKNVGFTELFTPADVDAALNKQDNTVRMLVLNSVCGCAAGTVRPGIVLSLLNEKVPGAYFSLFAGMEKEAVEYFRAKYLPGIPPSSPNIALFKNGQLLHLLQRPQVEGKAAADIAAELNDVYNNVCTTTNLPAEKAALENYIRQQYIRRE